ncbi:hypothetical protein PIB30_066946 [Stylosanthes scabra]|uniref:Protein FATTY ACID EXPORT 3, chloroplastic n=1 Tax=Stylosanthes scabra TaxID=79078 RepID=A0ABU6QLY1_9FABA|nr:hypothetical protein [Stylosanthes scabra]
MSFTMDSVSVLNPKLAATHVSVPFNKLPHCLSFDPLLRTRPCRVSLAVPQHVGAGFLTLNGRNLRGPLTVVFAAPHGESERREVEVEEEDGELPKESQEAWKQALDTFKEQALKFQGISQEAYELYSKKAIVVLNNTAEQLKIQADKARHDLGVAAKEITEEGKEYISTATENSPEVKEIVETFTSPSDDLSRISGVRDFYVGVPYGLLLSLGGFLNFMFTGSLAAIRFGVILGGVLLAFSVSSLRAYKRGHISPLALKGQAAIGVILFLREIRTLGRGSTFFNALISGVAAAFFVYRWILDGNQQRDSNLGSEAES